MTKKTIKASNYSIAAEGNVNVKINLNFPRGLSLGEDQELKHAISTTANLLHSDSSSPFNSLLQQVISPKEYSHQETLDIKINNIKLNLSLHKHLEVHLDSKFLLNGYVSEREEPLYTELNAIYWYSGLIAYGITNDITALKKLFSTKSEKSESVELNLLIFDIEQEVYTRNTEIENLKNLEERMIQTNHNDFNDKQKCKFYNSLGLLQRRIGERYSPNHLERAIKNLNKSLELCSSENVKTDILNNLGITLIRTYEQNTVLTNYLNDAEKYLNESSEIFNALQNQPLEYFMTQSKVLNNLGNVYKQRLFLNRKFSDGMKAIGFYDNASQIWREDIAPYEWGMLQKNKASILIFMAIEGDDVKHAEEALELAKSSLKYRTLESSPVQWLQSVKVFFKCCNFLIKNNKQAYFNEYQEMINTLESNKETFKEAQGYSEKYTNIMNDFQKINAPLL